MASLDLSALQGATFEAYFKVVDSAGTAIDCTGFEGRGKVRSSKSNATVVATLEVYCIDPTNGIWYITLTSTITAAIGASGADNNYVYDVEIFLPSDVLVYRPIQGAFSVNGEVTW